MAKSLVCDNETCVGCEICSNICAWKKFKSLNPRRGGIFVIRDDPSVFEGPAYCTNCGICIDICKEGRRPKGMEGSALNRVTDRVRFAKQWIEVDTEKCDGCGLCEAWCPYGAIKVDHITKKAVKCDLCHGEPACVEWCPQKCLKYADADGAAFYRGRTFMRSSIKPDSQTRWGKYKLWTKPWYKER